MDCVGWLTFLSDQGRGYSKGIPITYSCTPSYALLSVDINNTNTTRKTSLTFLVLVYL